ncbi:hypothetical protein [Haloferax sulfurifontis]|uniref:Uncharacterized protein n=2 Tax=Haloferax sulfurifontis TaxID=255616 RepID=M0IL94_9EURY|nr:hypothetical protein [Haloferax sulfurifontis]ELZ96628.1 hypothetical protein C441_04649 [Haloferax sulfurifontis ATCC BAA-897]GGC72354.1 hypothetical protein GCM10007209_37830 [Haloferax sulfurifontis]
MSDAECDYCGSSDLAYTLDSDRGPLTRCIPCLAIEQGQQALDKPFDAFVDLSPGIFHDSEEEVRESRAADYNRARGWFTVLARIQQDEPLLKRDPDAIGTVDDSIRTFLTNIMGSDAHYRPSEVAGNPVSAGQATFEDLGGSDGE